MSVRLTVASSSFSYSLTLTPPNCHSTAGPYAGPFGASDLSAHVSSDSASDLSANSR